MLSIGFSGWAQCRLATDPDPYDDPRGVSGYMRAYAGEPDLDRIIRFQGSPFVRSHCQSVGVMVREINLDGQVQSDHPLIGAAIGLLDRPVFEGRNGVVSEDGLEPIAPFHLEIRQGNDAISRATVPTDPSIPARFREFNAISLEFDPGVIERATGIADLQRVWRDRLSILERERPDINPALRPALEERITFLNQNLAAGGGAARFFAARMIWDYAIRSETTEQGGGLTALLPGFVPSAEPWRARFWFGGWDSDAQMFFVSGQLEIRDVSSPVATFTTRRPERLSDVI